MSRTRNIVELLPKLFQSWNVKSMLDVGCGTFNWAREIFTQEKFTHVDYVGVDVVPSVIENLTNVQNFSN